jgi:intracellular septation protein A
MAPGPHIGSSLFPAALAAAELAGGCGGAEFVAALAVGAELASRLNLSESQWRRLNGVWVAYFLFLGTTNLFALRYLDDNGWMNFKRLHLG